MKKYCLDTSGISNPLEVMPEDIHASLWDQLRSRVAAGSLAVTTEIFAELTHIPGEIGECLKQNEVNLVLEVGDASWDFLGYIEHATRMQQDHAGFIRENLGGKKGTVGLNDMSVIALAKTLGLPLISMEKRKAHLTDRLRQIPDVCDAEGVVHMTFNDYLRAEGIKL